MSKGEKGSFLLVIVRERCCFWSPGLAWSKTWRGAALERPETTPRDLSQQRVPPQNRVKQAAPEIDQSTAFSQRSCRRTLLIRVLPRSCDALSSSSLS